ncbi:MAG: transporter substrate-binding domain-containing protein [Clostridia bacterium]|nr:transporter substrate-binding domain-containing protein [Clostridia bacterium]
MNLSRRIIALIAALAVCLTLASCSAQKEDNGVAYEKDMKISAAADLEGKAVAVQLRSAEDAFIVAAKLTDYPKRYSDMKAAVQDLVDKKVAAVVVDANYAKQLTDGVEGVRIVEGSIGRVDYRFLLNQSDAKLAEKINQQIAALRESEDYQPMIESELVKGENYRVAKEDAELKKTFTLVAEPAFAPFAYEKKGNLRGLFAAAADAVAYGCGGRLETKTVDPVQIDDTKSQADTDEVTSFVTNEAMTVKGNRNALCVVTSEAAAEDTVFVTTDSFYTSELVMIVRQEEKK